MSPILWLMTVSLHGNCVITWQPEVSWVSMRVSVRVSEVSKSVWKLMGRLGSASEVLVNVKRLVDALRCQGLPATHWCKNRTSLRKHVLRISCDQSFMVASILTPLQSLLTVALVFESLTCPCFCGLFSSATCQIATVFVRSRRSKTVLFKYFVCRHFTEVLCPWLLTACQHWLLWTTVNISQSFVMPLQCHCWQLTIVYVWTLALQ